MGRHDAEWEHHAAAAADDAADDDDDVDVAMLMETSR
jgi:hypothetical protein